MATRPANSPQIQVQLTRSLERQLEEAQQSGDLKLSNRKLRDFPRSASDKYDLRDTVTADLSKNRFSELPEEIAQFPFLEQLYCHHNAIRFVSESIANLQCLAYLDLSRNELTSLAREICLLPIKILLVSNNSLTSLPDELHRMSHLTELDASSNQLTHLPPRMDDLRTLYSLNLRNNLLLALPLEVTLLPLVRLDVRANRIAVLPVEMRDMTFLVDLLVDDNPLTMPPSSLCRRGRVHIFKYLDIEVAKLGGRNSTFKQQPQRSAEGAICDRVKSMRRPNVDSGYSTSSDCYEKRWSQEILVLGDTEKQWIPSPLACRAAFDSNHHASGLHSPSSSGFSSTLELSNCQTDMEKTVLVNSHYSPSDSDLTTTVDNGISKAGIVSKPLNQIQTYREYKEALKQQRSIYRTTPTTTTTTKELVSSDQNLRTEPSTPTQCRFTNPLATSKSDPTPLNVNLLLSNGTSCNMLDVSSSPSSSSSSSSSLSSSALKSNNNNSNNSSSPKNVLYASSMPNGVDVSPTIRQYTKPASPLIVKQHSCGGGEASPSTTQLISANLTPPLNNNIESCSKMTFTMRREIDRQREESDLINQLRHIIESKLKMVLPEDLASALNDGVVLCHLANHIKPRSVASIHVPSPAVPKLTMARCRRNVENFIEACRKIGIDGGQGLCTALDVTAGTGAGPNSRQDSLRRLYATVRALCAHNKKGAIVGAATTSIVSSSPPVVGAAPATIVNQQQGCHRNDTTVSSLLLLTLLIGTVAFLITFPPPP